MKNRNEFLRQKLETKFQKQKRQEQLQDRKTTLVMASTFLAALLIVGYTLNQHFVEEQKVDDVERMILKNQKEGKVPHGRGNEILQKLLVEKGLLSKEEVDGVWGNKTGNAVRKALKHDKDFIKELRKRLENSR